MFMPSGGEMKQGVDDLSNIHIERLHHVPKEVRDLKYDALDKTQSVNAYAARSRVLGETKHGVHASASQYELFVAKAGNRVVGFLALQKTVGATKGAMIRQLWTAFPDTQQTLIVSKLLSVARVALSSRGIENVTAEKKAPTSAAEGRFFKFIEPGAKEGLEIDVSDDWTPAEEVGGFFDKLFGRESSNDNDVSREAA